MILDFKFQLLLWTEGIYICSTLIVELVRNLVAHGDAREGK